MTTPVRLAAAGAAAVTVLGAASAAVALSPITVTAKDPSPSVITPPTLVTRGQTVRVSENARAPITPVRFKVYPETYGFRPTTSACQGKFFTAYKKTGDSGRVVITLRPRKPLCKGVLYQAEALIGHGDVPDKFAHICVRGRTSPTGTACADNL
jgi:hypothetical protein